MCSEQFDVPILLIVFNRPQETEAVFQQIRSCRPKKLFIAADGPRKNRPEDKTNCEKTRELILQNISWDCEVNTLFREENLGCGVAVSSAISWFFKNVEAGIILEDDCLPNKDFFNFTKIMLNRFKDNKQVMHIAGCNLNVKIDSDYSYLYSIYNHIWGWASWKRAWEKYDFEIAKNNSFDRIISNMRGDFVSKDEREDWQHGYDLLKNDAIDTWDFQWTFSIWLNEGLAVIPTRNLITNIGFGENATHTKHDDFRSKLHHENLEEIVHNESITTNSDFALMRFKKLRKKKEKEPFTYWKNVFKKYLSRF